MDQFGKKTADSLSSEELKRIIEEITVELLGSPESRNDGDIKRTMTELVFERLKKLLPDNRLTDISVRKTINKLIEEVWQNIKENLGKDSKSSIAQEKTKTVEPTIPYVDYSNLPDISDNPALYLEYLKSQEFEEDNKTRKYVDIQLMDLKEAEKKVKKKEIAGKIEEIRKQASTIMLQKELFEKEFKYDKPVFVQKMIIQSISEKDLFEMIHRQLELLNYMEFLYDEINFKMKYGDYLENKTKIMFEVEILKPNLIFKLFSKNPEIIISVQKKLEAIIKISFDYHQKMQISSNLIYINIKNAFNIIDELFTLFNLCNEGIIEKVYLKISNLKLLFEGKLELLKLTEVFENLRIKLSKNLSLTKMDYNLKVEIQFIILNWIREILFFGEANIRNYIDSVKEKEVVEKIQVDLGRIREQSNKYIQSYEKDILQFLLVMGKYNGIAYFNHSFKEFGFEPNLLSGLLSAIQSFGHEILRSKTSIKNLQYEEFNIFLFYGEDIISALITKGKLIGPLYQKLEVFGKQFEKTFRKELIEFNGKVDVFRAAINLVPNFF